MRVLLVYPAPPREYWPMGAFRSKWVPSGLASLAGVLLRSRHNVRVLIREEQLARLGFDWDAAEAQMRQIIQEHQPEMVAFSVVSPAVAETARLAGLVKEMLGRHVITVAGGPHPTALPEQTLIDCPALDAVAIGEGEETIAELAEHGLGPHVAGLVIRREEGFVAAPPRSPVQDLDSLPAVPYHLFDMDYYTRRSRWLIRWLNLRATNIRTSRGCTNRCRFCAGYVVSGVGVRRRSIESVLEQVEFVVDRLGVEAVHFEDDTMGADPDRLMSLCDGLGRRSLNKRIVWDCCLRVDQAERALLREMKKAGCIQVEYGFESGSDQSLARLGKGAGSELNRRAAAITHEEGLRVFADIMVGLPGETRRDFRATVDFLRHARPEVISASKLCPLPGTAIFNSLSPEFRSRINWGGYSYLDQPAFDINLSAMSDRQFARLYRHFQRYFVRPATLWSLLQDTPAEDKQTRQAMRRDLRRFIMRHPLRAMRVPWRRGIKND